MRSCVNACYMYTVRLSPALNGSSEIQCFEHSDRIEICDGIIFDFYTRLPHMYINILQINIKYTLNTLKMYLLHHSLPMVENLQIGDFFCRPIMTVTWASQSMDL